jgi:PAS domain S-box-containing protein
MPSNLTSMARASGWAGMFWTAFKRSRNGMALLDDERRIVEVNPAFVTLLATQRSKLIGHHSWERVVGGPLMTPAEWRVALAEEEFSGVAELTRDDGVTLRVQFAGHPETVTGRRYVLAVALSHSRSRRRAPANGSTTEPLSEREREVVRLIGEGRTGPEIAEELQIAHNTVRTHAFNAMTKLGARSRAHLVAKALGGGHLAAA